MGKSRPVCPLSWSLENFMVLISFSGVLVLLQSPFAAFLVAVAFTIVFFYTQEHYGKDKSTAFQLFGSTLGKDLLFKDSAQGLLRIPSKMDTWLYLGYEYVTALRNLREDIRKY